MLFWLLIAAGCVFIVTATFVEPSPKRTVPPVIPLFILGVLCFVLAYFIGIPEG